MRAIHIFSGILLSLILLCSCEKEIAFNGEITSPLVVINSYITPDSIVSAHVSQSMFFLKDSVSLKNITNADVSVWVNGVFKEKMNPVENGTYWGTYRPLVGDIVKLIVKVPSKDEVTSVATIYSQPIVNSIDTTLLITGERYMINTSSTSSNGGPVVYSYDTIGKTLIRFIDYTLKFNDNATEKNYYRLVVDTKNIYNVTDPITNQKRDSITDNYYFDFNDVVSVNNSSIDPTSLTGGPIPGTFAVFSDELFNGKTYSLTFSTNENIYYYKPTYNSYYKTKNPDRKEIYVYLQSISKDLYLYLKSRAASESSGNSFFSEPIQIHNNIVGGIGIFGSYTSSVPSKFSLK